jgi:glycine cleavage system pyridoxal-binding protein P
MEPWRESTDVLGSRAEGLPVRDVGIASLDALDFVPAKIQEQKQERKQRPVKQKDRESIKKRKGKHQLNRRRHRSSINGGIHSSLSLITNASFAMSSH